MAQFLLDESIKTLNIDQLKNIFNFKLRSTGEFFSKESILISSKQIREKQRLGEFLKLNEVDLYNIREMLTELNYSVLGSSLKIDYTDIVDKINMMINIEEDNISDRLVDFLQQLKRSNRIVQFEKLRSTAEKFLNLADSIEQNYKIAEEMSNMENIENKYQSIKSSNSCCEYLKSEICAIKNTFQNIFLPFKNQIFYSGIVKAIRVLFNKQALFSEAEINITKPDIIETNILPDLHKFIIKNLNITALEKEEEINKVLKINSKIKYEGEGIFRVPRGFKMKELDSYGKVIFKGTNKNGTLFTYKRIIEIVERTETIKLISLIIDMHNIYSLGKYISIHQNLLDEFKMTVNLIDLNIAYLNSNMKYISSLSFEMTCDNDKCKEIRKYINIFFGKLIHKISLNEFYHPLIEDCISSNFYLENKINNFITISGPNTSGKTTILRSIALIVYLNQMGAPVAIKSNSYISIFSFLRIRIGSEDMEGQSTFMREMREISEMINIIKYENNPLILVDELGRGTSVLDGISISLAMKHFLVKRNIFTFFVTHFEELKEKENGLYHLSLEKYRLINDIGNSYGIECAKKCDFPENVIERAYKIFKDK